MDLIRGVFDPGSVQNINWLINSYSLFRRVINHSSGLHAQISTIGYNQLMFKFAQCGILGNVFLRSCVSTPTPTLPRRHWMIQSPNFQGKFTANTKMLLSVRWLKALQIHRPITSIKQIWNSIASKILLDPSLTISFGEQYNTWVLNCLVITYAFLYHV